MADKALTDLPDGGAATSGDVIYVVRGGNSRKAGFPDLSGFATTAQLAGKFDAPAGTTSQYIRGDGSLATFPTLADVATTGDYGDLDNTPTLGGAAALDVGTSAGTVAAGDDSRFTTSPSNAQTANYTLVLSDAGKTVRMSNSSARTITIPPNASVAFPVDTVVNFETVGTGDCTIAAGSGVTIRSRNGLKLAGQYAVATAHKIDTNEWILAGDLTE